VPVLTFSSSSEGVSTLAPRIQNDRSAGGGLLKGNAFIGVSYVIAENKELFLVLL